MVLPIETKCPDAPSTERSMPKLVPVASQVSLTAPAAAVARRLKPTDGGPRGWLAPTVSVRRDSAVSPFLPKAITRTVYGPGASVDVFQDPAQTAWSRFAPSSGPPAVAGTARPRLIHIEPPSGL